MRHTRVGSIGVMALASFVGGAVANVALARRVQARAQTPIVTAQQLNLVDGAGRLRAILSAEDERGLVSLSLFDASGAVRALLAVAPNGTPQLRLYDEAGSDPFAVTVESGGPVLELRGGNDRAALLGAPNGVPVLSFLQEGQSRVELGVSSRGAPRFGMFSQTGQQRASMIVGDDGAPWVVLYDDRGRGRVRIGVVQGASVINMADETQPRIVLGVASTGEPSLNFYDEGGQIVHRVP